MQIAVDQRLGAGHEVPLGGADRGDHLGIVGVGSDVRSARRRHRATARGRIRLAEDEQLGDLAERGVDRFGDEQLELLRIDAERGGSERDIGDVPPERGRRAVVAFAVVERAAPDPVVGQILDRERVPLRVGVVEHWDRTRAQPPVCPQRPSFCVVAGRRHRPRGIGAHVRQGLLDHQAGSITVGRLAADDEDEVQVAVPDLANGVDTSQSFGERGSAGDVLGDGVDGERLVVGVRHLAPSAGAASTSLRRAE